MTMRDEGYITIGAQDWLNRECGAVACYVRLGWKGVKTYRSRRAAARARQRQLAMHAVGLAPRVVSDVHRVIVCGSVTSRWGYETGHATHVGLTTKEDIDNVVDLARRLGKRIPVCERHDGNFGRWDGRWVVIDFTDPNEKRRN